MEFIKKNIKYIGIVMICVFCSYLVTLATNYAFESSDVRFDNTGTSLESVNVQDALDETFHHVTDYNEIKTTIGNNTLTTTAQTLTGAVNELKTSVSSLNDHIGNSKIINGIYYTSATTIETIQNDIDAAIAQYAEPNKPKFMQFGYMNGTAGASVGLYACFINIQFIGTSLIHVEFVKMDNSGTRNYMAKIITWSNIR